MHAIFGSLDCIVNRFSNFVVKADQSAYYVNDFALLSNNAIDFIRNIGSVFKRIRYIGLKRTVKKCHSGFKQIEILGRTVSLGGISPQAGMIQNFLIKISLLKSKKDHSAI